MITSSTEHKGVIIGYVSWKLAEQRRATSREGEVLLKAPCIIGYLQVLVDGSIEQVRCPLRGSRIVLEGGRAPTAKEMVQVVHTAQNVFPTGMEVDLICRHYSDGRKENKSFVLKGRPHVNSDSLRGHPHFKKEQRPRQPADQQEAAPPVQEQKEAPSETSLS